MINPCSAKENKECAQNICRHPEITASEVYGRKCTVGGCGEREFNKIDPTSFCKPSTQQVQCFLESHPRPNTHKPHKYNVLTFRKGKVQCDVIHFT